MVLVWPIPVCLLVWWITENMSSAIIIFGIAFLMLFVASPDYKPFVILGALGVTIVTAAVFILTQMDISKRQESD